MLLPPKLWVSCRFVLITNSGYGYVGVLLECPAGMSPRKGFHTVSGFVILAIQSSWSRQVEYIWGNMKKTHEKLVHVFLRRCAESLMRSTLETGSVGCPQKSQGPKVPGLPRPDTPNTRRTPLLQFYSDTNPLDTNHYDQTPGSRATVLLSRCFLGGMRTIQTCMECHVSVVTQLKGILPYSYS